MYGQKWIRIHDIAGKPKEAYVVSKTEGEAQVLMSVHFPFDYSQHTLFVTHISKLHKHWRLADKGIQTELFTFTDTSIKETWRRKHLKG